jgi:hypothetical protein
MQEDKLKSMERLRLECLAQALNYSGIHHAPERSTSNVIKVAKKFEHYLISGEDDE